MNTTPNGPLLVLASVRRFHVAYREPAVVETPSEPSHTPARLSYVGVLRSIPLPALYGALCFVTAGVALVSFRVDLSVMACVCTLTAMAYASFVGLRTTVQVGRAAGTYFVTVRSLFRTRVLTTQKLPRLVSREYGKAIGKLSLGSQLALSLELGHTTLSLPHLHVGATVTDTEARLEGFREALRALAQIDDEQPESEKATKARGRWSLPEVPIPAGGTVDSVSWAKGPALRDDLRQGVSVGILDDYRGILFASIFACGLVVAAALVPSALSLSHRATVAGTALALATGFVGLLTYERTIRIDAPAGPKKATVVLETRVFGLRRTRRVPLGEGLRMVLAARTSEESNRSVTAFLVSTSGALHHVAEAQERSALSSIESFGVALAVPRLVDAALEPRSASRDEPKPTSSASALPMKAPRPPEGLTPRLALFAALGATLFGMAMSIAVRDIASLWSTTAWRQTTCSFESVRTGKSSRMHAHPSFAPSVSVPVSLGSYMTEQVCWILDDAHGYDILRFTPPSGSPAPWEKIHDSTQYTFAFLWVSAIVLAGPWLRRRRSFDVRADSSSDPSAKEDWKIDGRR